MVLWWAEPKTFDQLGQELTQQVSYQNDVFEDLLEHEEHLEKYPLEDKGSLRVVVEVDAEEEQVFTETTLTVSLLI